MTSSTRSLSNTLPHSEAPQQDELTGVKNSIHKKIEAVDARCAERSAEMQHGIKQVKTAVKNMRDGIEAELLDTQNEVRKVHTELESTHRGVQKTSAQMQKMRAELEGTSSGVQQVRDELESTNRKMDALIKKQSEVGDAIVKELQRLQGVVALSPSDEEESERGERIRGKMEDTSSNGHAEESLEPQLLSQPITGPKDGVALIVVPDQSLPVTCNGCVASHRYGEDGKFARAYTLTDEQKGRAEEILKGFKRYVQDLEEESLDKFNISLAEEKVSWEKNGQRVYKKFSDLKLKEQERNYRFMPGARNVERCVEETEQFFTEISGFSSRPFYHRGEEDGRLSTRSYGPGLKSLLPTSAQQKDYVAAMSLYQKLESDPTKRTQAFKRVGQAELMIEQLRARVTGNLQYLDRCLQQHETSPSLNEHRRQFQRLLKVKQKLESIDTFALYLAVAYADSANVLEATTRADKLRKEVGEYLLQQMGAPYLSSEAQDYTTDVGGLIFYGLADEEIADREYGKYCQRHYIRENAKGLSEAIVRGVVHQNNRDLKHPVLERLYAEVEADEKESNEFLEELGTRFDHIAGVVVPDASESFQERTLNTGRKFLGKPQTLYALDSQVAQMRTAARLYVSPKPIPPSRPVNAYSPSIRAAEADEPL